MIVISVRTRKGKKRDDRRVGDRHKLSDNRGRVERNKQSIRDSKQNKPSVKRDYEQVSELHKISEKRDRTLNRSDKQESKGDREPHNIRIKRDNEQPNLNEKPENERRKKTYGTLNHTNPERRRILSSLDKVRKEREN